MENMHLRQVSPYNEQRMRSEAKECAVPVDPTSGAPILLVPKRFLSELPKMNDLDFH